MSEHQLNRREVCRVFIFQGNMISFTCSFIIKPTYDPFIIINRMDHINYTPTLARLLS